MTTTETSTSLNAQLKSVLESTLNSMDNQQQSPEESKMIDNESPSKEQSSEIDISTSTTASESWTHITDTNINKDINCQQNTSSFNSNQSNYNSNEININDYIEIEKDEDIEYDSEKALIFKRKGNDYFKMKEFEDAIDEYCNAIKYCPKKETEDKKQLSIFYCNRAAAFIELEEYENAIQDCNKCLEFNDQYIKGFWRRAKAYEKMEKFYEAQEDYNCILNIDNDHQFAKMNLKRIEPMVKEQFERQKTEVVDKLKTFANWGLGKIGLSLENFKAEQDPTTGAYNIKFQQ